MRNTLSPVLVGQLSESDRTQHAIRLYRQMKEVDFSPVIQTALRESGITTVTEAHDFLDAFLQWFSLIPEALDSQPLQMLESVDRIWHAMILNTAFYRKFCEEFVGEYVDHNPMDVTQNTRATKRAYADYTLALLKRTYGDQVHPALLRLHESITCCCGGSCGSSKS